MLLRVLILFLFTYQVQAELYRCTSANGKIQYTDLACPDTGARYQPKAIMSNYKAIKAVNAHNKSKPSKNSDKNQTCPFFSSTELRTLRVKDEYKKGLTQTHIEHRLGAADDITTNKNKSNWVYNGDNVNRIFRFKDGCLTGWKERWKGKESKISKFRDEK